MTKSNKFSPEVRERAVRMVQEHRGDYPSLWSAIESIAPKIGCVPQTLNEWVKKAEVDSVIILDDLFLARRISEHAAEVLQAIVHQRYKLRRSIVITSNRVVQDWGKYLGDATMATTILDRLMHRCAMLEFEGKSYRLKEAAARIAVSPESS